MADEKSSNNPFLGEQKIPVSQNTSPAPPILPQNESPSRPQPEEKSPVEAPLSPPELVTSPEKRRSRRWIFRSIVILVLVLLVGAGVYFWVNRVAVTLSPEIPVPEPTQEETTPPTIETGESTLAIGEEDVNYTSESFKAGEIVIGGELQFLVDEEEVGPLLVENIRGEAFTEKNKQEVKLVVTWTTNKLTQAAVLYSKGIGQTERSVEEDDFSYNHSVIIAGLDPASTYLYTIDASDRYGNQTKSEPHAVFTGARTVSLFDLIAGAIGEVFGWAVTK